MQLIIVILACKGNPSTRSNVLFVSLYGVRIQSFTLIVEFDQYKAELYIEMAIKLKSKETVNTNLTPVMSQKVLKLHLCVNLSTFHQYCY